MKEYLWKSRDGEYWVKKHIDNLYLVKNRHVTYSMSYEDDKMAVEVIKSLRDSYNRKMRRL